MLQDNKVSGTHVGTRVVTSMGTSVGTSVGTSAAIEPGPVPSRSATGFLGESQVNGSYHCQTRFELYQGRPGCLRLLGRISMKWQTHRGQCVLAETVNSGWEDLGCDRP